MQFSIVFTIILFGTLQVQNVYGGYEQHDPQVIGLNIEPENAMNIEAEKMTTMRLFGYNLSEEINIAFTSEVEVIGSICNNIVSPFKIIQASESGEWALVNFQLPAMAVEQDRWYMCILDLTSGDYKHQGSHEWLTFKSYCSLSMWVYMFLILCCISFSGLFSGLDLSLTGLDMTQLTNISRTGSPQEQNYARSIMQIRCRGNYLRSTLVFCNTLINAILNYMFGNITTGFVCIIVSAMVCMTIGNLIPVALVSRHRLAVGAKLRWLVWSLMVITCPLTWTFGKFLDLTVGEDRGSIFVQEQLTPITKESNPVANPADDNNRDRSDSVVCPDDDKTDYVAGTDHHISISMPHLDNDSESSNPVVSSANDDDSKMSDSVVIPIEEDDNERSNSILCSADDDASKSDLISSQAENHISIWIEYDN